MVSCQRHNSCCSVSRLSRNKTSSTRPRCLCMIPSPPSTRSLRIRHREGSCHLHWRVRRNVFCDLPRRMMPKAAAVSAQGTPMLQVKKEVCIRVVCLKICGVSLCLPFQTPIWVVIRRTCCIPGALDCLLGQILEAMLKCEATNNADGSCGEVDSFLALLFFPGDGFFSSLLRLLYLEPSLKQKR